MLSSYRWVTETVSKKLFCFLKIWAVLLKAGFLSQCRAKGHPSRSCWYLQCQCANDTAHPRWHCAKYIEYIIYNRNFPNIQIYLNSKTGKECQGTARVLFNKLLHNLFWTFFFLFAIAVDWFLPKKKKTKTTTNQKNRTYFYLLKHVSHLLFLIKYQLFSTMLRIVPAYTKNSQNSSEL